MYEELYGYSACTENVKYSLHMPDDIVRPSTLDNYWCYLYTPHTHPLGHNYVGSQPRLHHNMVVIGVTMVHLVH